MLAVVGLLLFGTASSVLSKVAYDFQAVGLDGQLKHFHKPLFLVLVMFLSK